MTNNGEKGKLEGNWVERTSSFRPSETFVSVMAPQVKIIVGLNVVDKKTAYWDLLYVLYILHVRQW